MHRTTEPPLPHPVTFEHKGKTYTIPGDALAGPNLRALRLLVTRQRARDWESTLEHVVSIRRTKPEVAEIMQAEARMKLFIPVSNSELFAALKDPEALREFLPLLLKCSAKDADDIVESYPYLLSLSDMIEIATGWNTHLGNLDTLRQERETDLRIALEQNGEHSALAAKKSIES